MRLSASAIAALAAAFLFGISTPLAKLLSADIPPILLAGLLYVGSGLGLALLRAVRERRISIPHLSAAEWLWFVLAIALGGVLAPVLLLSGLERTSAADASLLLNLEAVFTAALAWIAFGEHADRRIVLGMVLIIAGGIVLGSPRAGQSHGSTAGTLLVSAACLCWALDNNLTRKISGSDSLFIAGTKGLVAGITNTALALALGARLPAAGLTLLAMTVGLAGYGVSLVLYVLALRGLGAARAGAYFCTAPFVGAALAIAVLHEPLSSAFCIASLLMGIGVWLHLTEHHEHEHTHGFLEHDHVHRHDSHHQHVHTFEWDGREPHAHPHQHRPVTHRHPHFPDLHHQHGH
jgi:drug/metabolite transporter (DMT)-like permease